MSNGSARFDWLWPGNQVSTGALRRATGNELAAMQKGLAAGEKDTDEARRSRATDNEIRAFLDAWRTGDGAAQKNALNKIVEGWRADNAAGGVPVYAHLPLPKDFARVLARFAGGIDDAAGAPSITSVVAALDPGVRASVAQQIAGLKNRDVRENPRSRLHEGVHAEERRNREDSLVPWVRDSGRTRTPQLHEHLTSLLKHFDMERARRPQEEPATLRSFGHLLDNELVRRAADSHGDPGDEVRPSGAWRTMEYDEARDGDINMDASPWRGELAQVQTLQGAPFSEPPKQDPPRIVRAYRRYTSPNLTPAQMAQEDRDADDLARDADMHIRELIRAIEADQSLRRDRDPLVQEFLRSLMRYFSENGDRAVVSPAPGDRRASMHRKDHLAAYDPSSDRIVFSSLFKGLSREKKIITLMHELLHTTLIAKDEAARSGYHNDRKGGMIYAKHEAWLDNLAIRLAKRLKLIPRDYPETSWRDYYTPPGG